MVEWRVATLDEPMVGWKVDLMGNMKVDKWAALRDCLRVVPLERKLVYATVESLAW